MPCPPKRVARRWVWIPVAVAVLIQALLFFTFQPETTFDSDSYMAQAESLAASGSALNALGEPDTVRTPGYPLYLAAFLLTKSGYAGAVIFQRILWILVVALTTWLSFRVTGSAIASTTAGLITAIDLPALQATNSILTETVATVFVGAAVWAAYQSASLRSARVAGVAGQYAGAAALVRPVAILLGVPLAIGILIAGARECRVRIAAITLAASLVFPVVWIARNYVADRCRNLQLDQQHQPVAVSGGGHAGDPRSRRRRRQHPAPASRARGRGLPRR